MDDRSPTVFAVTLTLGICATVFVALRVVSKIWVVRKFRADDVLVVIAWVFATGVSAAVCSGARVGLGQPDSGIRPEWAEPMKKATYAFTVLYNPALMATKTSILILYIRMATAHRFLRYASIATAIIINIAGIVLTFLGLFQCRPIAAGFSTSVDGTCIDVVSMYLASAPINILTDLAILCLPLPILTQLRMEFKQKIALVVTFCVGAFVAIVDVVRILYLQNALRETSIVGSTITSSTRPANFTYHASFSLMWSAVEVSVGLCCCCVLVLKPLVMRVMPELLGGHTKESRRATSASHASPEKTEPAELPPVEDDVDFFQMLDGPQPGSPRPDVNSLEDEDGMDFFQMLASDPATIKPPPVSPTRPRRLTQITPLRRPPQHPPEQGPTQTFFDFVNMKGRTPLTELSAREAWWPIMFVSSLFALWGFSYGLLGTLNAEVQSLLNYSPARTIALHNAYFLGYFLGPPLVGYWALTREGFKATFIAGLAIYSCGAMSYWPSTVLRSYPGFFISNLIVALGLSVLENAANPFVALAGPGHLSESRLCFSQALQGVGALVSSIMASRALFVGLSEDDLFRVQWCYLAVALFVVALAVVFYYVPLSEATDDELEAMALQRLYNADMDRGEKAWKMDARKALLAAGIVLMAVYVGAQEAVSYFWGSVSLGAYPSFDPAASANIGAGLFAMGRFISAGLTYVFPPRYVLFGYMFGSFLSSLIAMVAPPGPVALAFLVLLQFFESAIFPLLFAMTLRGQGKHTKLAATAVTAAIVGGAIWPSVVFAVDMDHRDNPRYSIRVTTGLYAVAMLWPIAISLNKTARRWLDPVWSKRNVARGSVEGSEATMVEWTPRTVDSKGVATHLEVMVEEDESGKRRENG